MYRKVAAALVAVIALALAGCGGSETKLTRAQLVRKIEVACRQGQQLAQRQQSSNRAKNGFIIAISAGEHVVMDKLGDLNPPDAAKADFEAMKAAVQQRLDLIDRVKAAGSAGAQRMIRAVQADAEAATRKAQEAQRKLGVKGCI